MCSYDNGTKDKHYNTYCLRADMLHLPPFFFAALWLDLQSTQGLSGRVCCVCVCEPAVCVCVCVCVSLLCVCVCVCVCVSVYLVCVFV